jgi:hypothetical protein
VSNSLRWFSTNNLQGWACQSFVASKRFPSAVLVVLRENIVESRIHMVCSMYLLLLLD